MAGSSWKEDEVVHLLHRAAFSATRKEVQTCLQLGKTETVRRIMSGISITGEDQTVPSMEQIKADGKALKTGQIRDQQLYWLYRMAYSPAPFIEKMTLFWHGHFATSYAKVRDVTFMAQQNNLFRKNALGSFRDMVMKVSVDPAMMKWLDINSNRKGRANENYAREVMELFTLGIGHYTEDDVKAAARALTGWHVSKTGEVIFHAKQHDNTVKTILGHTGNFNEPDFINILFEQPAMSIFLATKLLTFFATPTPSQAWIQHVAEDFKKQPTIGDVMKNLFLSVEFYNPAYRLSVIKTPAEYVAWIIRSFQLPLSKRFTYAMANMGQQLYYPPDVKGWRGGNTWLMTTNLLARSQFAELVSREIKRNLFTSPAYSPLQKENAAAWISLWSGNIGLFPLGKQTQTAIEKFAEDSFIHVKNKNFGYRGMLDLLLISPEAQMK